MTRSGFKTHFEGIWQYFVQKRLGSAARVPSEFLQLFLGHHTRKDG
jgi:hypothetical protein